MKPGLIKYLLALALIAPLLTGCNDGDDDDGISVPLGGEESRSGDDADPNSVTAIFDEPANSEPVAIDSPEALAADMEVLFGEPAAEPQEPGEVLDLGEDG